MHGLYVNVYRDQYPLKRTMITPLHLYKPHIVWTGRTWMCSSRRYPAWLINREFASSRYDEAEKFVEKLNKNIDRV